jgi:hypothetical protein
MNVSVAFCRKSDFGSAFNIGTPSQAGEGEEGSGRVETQKISGLHT